MKKLILAAFALTTAASVFAQGTIIFNNRLSATAHVWGPSSTDARLSLQGLGSNDSPSGTVAFGAASGMAMIGAGGLTGVGGASTTFAQLIGAVGAGAAESSLVPQGATTTFRTGGAQGNIAGITVTLSTIPQDAPAATFEMVAWDNSSGLYANWSLASVAWQAGLIVAGKSVPFTINGIGGTGAPPTTVGMGSFNLYSLAVIPEPSTFALAGLGLAALVAFRRRS